MDLFVHFPCHADANKTHSFKLKFSVFKNSPMSLIIGRDSIKEYELFSYMPSQISLLSIQSRGDDTLSPRRTDVLCRSCTCSEDPIPLVHAVKRGGISHPTASLDTFSMLVDPPDQSIEVEVSSYADTNGIGAFEPFLVAIGPEMDLLS